MIMGDMKHLDAYKAQMPDFIYEVLKEASQFDFAGVPDGKYKNQRLQYECGDFTDGAFCSEET